MVEPILAEHAPSKRGPKCRAILIWWNKKARNYLGLLKLACALLWFRRYRRLAG